MWSKLTRNWGLKIAAILFAILLWLVVTNINDPVGTYRVYNVPVTIQNTNLITDNGQVYEVLDNTDVIDVVTISAKRSIIDSLNESNVVAVADMNDLTNIDTIAIQLSTNKYNDKLESIKGSIDTVKLNIETEKTKTLPLRAETTGELKDDYIVGEVTAEQNLVVISGPESVVSQIKRAVASVDVSGFTSNISTDADVRLYDENDEEITADSLVKSISKVRVTVEILATAKVPVTYQVSGEPAEGFEANGENSISKSSVTIAGRPSVLQNVSSIDIPASAIDITDAEDDVSFALKLEDYLPSGISLADDADNTVTVTIGIEPVAERTIRLPVSGIALTGVPDGYEGELVADGISVEVVLAGLPENLEKVSSTQLSASFDVAAWMEEEGMEELAPGDYTVELAIELAEDIEGVRLSNSVTIGLHISDEDEED